MTLSPRTEGLSRLEYLGHLAVSLLLAGFLELSFGRRWGGIAELSRGLPSGEFLPFSLLLFGALFLTLWIFIGATRRRMASARLPEWIFWVLFAACASLPIVSVLIDSRLPWLATFLSAYSLIATAFMVLLVLAILIVRDFGITPLRADLPRSPLHERRMNPDAMSDRVDPSIKVHPALRDYFRKDRRKQ